MYFFVSEVNRDVAPSTSDVRAKCLAVMVFSPDFALIAPALRMRFRTSRLNNYIEKVKVEGKKLTLNKLLILALRSKLFTNFW